MEASSGLVVLTVLFLVMALFAVSVFITFRKEKKLEDDDSFED